MEFEHLFCYSVRLVGVFDYTIKFIFTIHESILFYRSLPIAPFHKPIKLRSVIFEVDRPIIVIFSNVYG